MLKEKAVEANDPEEAKMEIMVYDVPHFLQGDWPVLEMISEEAVRILQEDTPGALQDLSSRRIDWKWGNGKAARALLETGGNLVILWRLGKDEMDEGKDDLGGANEAHQRERWYWAFLIVGSEEWTGHWDKLREIAACAFRFVHKVDKALNYVESERLECIIHPATSWQSQFSWKDGANTLTVLVHVDPQLEHITVEWVAPPPAVRARAPRRTAKQHDNRTIAGGLDPILGHRPT